MKNNMDENIESIEKLADGTERYGKKAANTNEFVKSLTDSLTELESASKLIRDVQKELTGTTKKYADILLKSTQKSNRYKSSIDKVRDSKKSLVKSLLDENKKLKEKGNALEEVRKKIKKLSYDSSSNKDKIKDLEKEKKKYKDQVDSHNELIRQKSKLIKLSNKYAKNLDTEQKALSKSVGKGELKGVGKKGDLGSRLSGLLQKKQEGEINLVEKQRGTLGDEAADAQIRTIKSSAPEALVDIISNIEGLTESQRDWATSVAHGMGEFTDIKDIPKAFSQSWAEEALNAKDEMSGLLSTLFSKGSITNKAKAVMGLDQISKRAQEVAVNSGEGAQGLKGVKGMFKLLTMGLKALVIAMKSFPLIGWVMALVGTLKAAMSAFMKLDKFIKGLNKEFFKMYGPTGLMKDVKGTMREFTDAVYNLQRNLKLGVGAEGHMETVKGLTGGGLSLEGVRRRSGYGDILEEGVNLSRLLGESFQDVGDMLQKQMLDLNTTFDNASKKLRILGYDAAKSGVSMRTFYQASLSSAEGLAYYGNYLETASKLLSDYHQQAGISMQQAQKLTQDQMQAISSMDTQQRAALANMLGKDELESAFKGAGDKIGHEIEQVTKKMSDTTISVEERKGLERDLKDLERRRRQAHEAERAVSEGRVQDAFTHFELLAADFEKIMMTISERNPLIDLFKQDFQTLRVLGETLGLSEDLVKGMGDVLHERVKEIDQLLSEGGLLDRMVLSGDQLRNLSTAFKGFEKDMDKEKFDKIVDEMGLETTLSEEIKDTANNHTALFQKMLNSLKEGNRDLGLNREDIKSIAVNTANTSIAVRGLGDKDEENALLKQVRDQTTTYEDILGITKEHANYYAATLGVTDWAGKAALRTAETVGGIFSFLTSRFGRKSQDYGRELSIKDFRESSHMKGLETLVAEQVLLMRILEHTDTESKEFKQLNSELSELSNEIKEFRREGITAELQQQGLVDAQEKVKSVLGDKDKLSRSDMGSLRRSGARSRGSGKIGSWEGSSDWFDTAGLNDEIKRAEEDLKEARTRSRDGGIISNLFHGVYRKERVLKDLDHRRMVEALGEQGSVDDGIISKRGHAFLAPGDVVVNTEGIAGGIKGQRGEFMTRAIDMMSKNSNTRGGDTVTIPVNVSIDKVEGDPDLFVRKLQPVMSQAFERFYYEKQKGRT